MLCKDLDLRREVSNSSNMPVDTFTAYLDRKDIAIHVNQLAQFVVFIALERVPVILLAHLPQITERTVHPFPQQAAIGLLSSLPLSEFL